MAVALNNTSTGTISGSASLTISHTVGSGSDRYLEVSVCCTNSSDYLAAATCTYGGTSMGSPIVTAVVGSSNRFTYVWGMVAPTSGTANVVITPSSGAYLDAIVRDYTGVHQSTPVANSTKYANLISSPLSTQTLTCPTNGLLADFFTVRATGQTLTPGASQTRSGTTIAGGVSTSSGSTKASSDLSWSAWTGSQGVAHVGIALSEAAAADTTAPVLTSGTGTATGSTTATVGATTDEGNGTMYAVVTTSATQPSVAQIKAGQNDTGSSAVYSSSQAISSTGAKTFSATGLTASTTYYAHLVHTDAATNNSNRISSASFTTTSAGPTINSQPSNQSVVTPATATFSVSATSSGGALSYQWQRQPAAGGGYSNISAATSSSYTTGATDVSGGSHNNGDTYRVTVTDSNGSINSSAATLTVSSSASTLTSLPLVRNTGVVAASVSLSWITLLDDSDGSFLATKTGVSTDSSGIFSTSDASLTSGLTVRAVWLESTGERGQGWAVIP